MRVLFDTDPGVDDALALLYLHRHPDVELAGITTVEGNGTLETVTRNARYLVERFGIDAPVARGVAASLQIASPPAPHWIHGHNALGDVPIEPEPQLALDPRPAHRFIIDAVRERPGDLTIVAVAKFTNIALALAEDPEIANLVRNVVVMGGAFGTAGRCGNITPAAEANVYHDPHAADIVFTAAWPVTIVGLDVTEAVVMNDDYLAALRDAGTPEGRFIYEISRGYQDFHEGRDGMRGIYAHDPLASICALHAELFTFVDGPVRVVTDGPAVGHTIQRLPGRAYPANGWDGVSAQRVAVSVDAPRALADFAAVVNGERAHG